MAEGGLMTPGTVPSTCSMNVFIASGPLPSNKTTQKDHATIHEQCYKYTKDIFLNSILGSCHFELRIRCSLPRHWCFMPVILAIWEAGVRRIIVPG
jgi:hypothetical protein